MIPRYARPEMTTLWEAESRFSIWLDIETHALDAMVELGIVPADAAKAVRDRGGAEHVQRQQHEDAAAARGDHAVDAAHERAEHGLRARGEARLPRDGA